MILNQLKLLHPYCAFPFCYGMHSRDTTVLIDLMSCTTAVCFSTFFKLATIVPTVLKFPNFLASLFVDYYDYK